METPNNTGAKNRIRRMLKRERMIDISNMDDQGEGITIVSSQARSVPHYYVGPLDLRSKTADKIKLFFEIMYPEYRYEAMNFAIDYNDYQYLAELINNAILRKDYRYIIGTTSYAISNKNHKVLEIIIAQDLPISMYEEIYRMAHDFEDEQAKDMIWNKIAQRTLLRFEAIDNLKINPDVDRSIKRL